jgi:hypothetical protein
MPRCLDLLTRSCPVLGMLNSLDAHLLNEDRLTTIPEAVWANFGTYGNERLVACSIVSWLSCSPFVRVLSGHARTEHS